MANVEVEPTAVTHRTKPWLGTGMAFRTAGKDAIEVQWPGSGLTRHESVENLVPGRFPMSWPLPAERRRTRG